MLRLLIQNISEIVVVIDPYGIIRFSNPQLEKVLGRRTEDVVGRNIFDFIHPDDTRRAALVYSKTVGKPGEPETFDAAGRSNMQYDLRTLTWRNGSRSASRSWRKPTPRCAWKINLAAKPRDDCRKPFRCCVRRSIPP